MLETTHLAASHPRRTESSATPLSKPQILCGCFVMNYAAVPCSVIVSNCCFQSFNVKLVGNIYRFKGTSDSLLMFFNEDVTFNDFAILFSNNLKWLLFYSSCVPYVPDPENTTLLQASLRLFKRFDQFPQAMRVAMQLNDMHLMEEIFTSCSDL
jgi:hypothetical protein